MIESVTSMHGNISSLNKVIRGETQAVHGLVGQSVILLACSCVDTFEKSRGYNSFE